MSAGLTFDPNSVTVKVNGENFAAANYDLVASGLTDGCTFELRFHDADNASVLKPNDVVTVEPATPTTHGWTMITPIALKSPQPALMFGK